MALAPQRKRGYILNRCVGQGTYGTVYHARHQDGSPQEYAIKVIDRCKLSTQSAQDNLVREIELLVKLKHPHLVQLFEFWCDAKEVVMVMEFCAGGDLYQFIQSKQQLQEPHARHFLRQLASALQYLHSQQVAHLDLKPQNLMLVPLDDRAPILKVADFGFACRILAADLKESLRGSPLYMAPEMVAQGKYDARADLWSTGVILFESLFGFAPFTSQTYAELWQKIRSVDEVQIPQDRPLSADCRNLLQGLLQRDPDKRMSFEQFFADPFVDLAHLPCESSCEKAKQYALQAVDFDTAGETGKAYQAYAAALDFFVPAIQYEPDPVKRQALRKHTHQYFERAEELKEQLSRTFPRASAPPQCPFSQTSGAAQPQQGQTLAAAPTAPPPPDPTQCLSREPSSPSEDTFADVLAAQPGVFRKVQNAISKAREARLHDNPRDFKIAQKKYEEAIELYMSAIKEGNLGPNPEQQLRHRAYHLLKRAEEIRKYEDGKLNTMTLPPEPPQTHKNCCIQ